MACVRSASEAVRGQERDDGPFPRARPLSSALRPRRPPTRAASPAAPTPPLIREPRSSVVPDPEPSFEDVEAPSPAAAAARRPRPRRGALPRPLPRHCIYLIFPKGSNIVQFSLFSKMLPLLFLHHLFSPAAAVTQLKVSRRSGHPATDSRPGACHLPQNQRGFCDVWRCCCHRRGAMPWGWESGCC